eukprot:7783014-Karenia_brevis.AAC.1
MPEFSASEVLSLWNSYSSFFNNYQFDLVGSLDGQLSKVTNEKELASVEEEMAKDQDFHDDGMKLAVEDAENKDKANEATEDDGENEFKDDFGLIPDSLKFDFCSLQ